MSKSNTPALLPVTLEKQSKVDGCKSLSILRIPEDHLDAVIDRFCTYLLHDMEATPEVGLERTVNHIKEILEYLEMDVNDVVFAFCLARRYLGLYGSTIRTCVQLSVVVYHAVYTEQAFVQDVNVSKDFWQHVTAKSFFRFYDNVLTFCSRLDFRLDVPATEFNSSADILVCGALPRQTYTSPCTSPTAHNVPHAVNRLGVHLPHRAGVEKEIRASGQSPNGSQGSDYQRSPDRNLANGDQHLGYGDRNLGQVAVAERGPPSGTLVYDHSSGKMEDLAVMYKSSGGCHQRH